MTKRATWVWAVLGLVWVALLMEFVWAPQRAPIPYKIEEVTVSVDAEVRRILDEQHARASRILGAREATGGAVTTILGRLANGDHDLVVIGTHGRRGVVRAALGSVAEDVLRRAPCPVLCVREAVRP